MSADPVRRYTTVAAERGPDESSDKLRQCVRGTGCGGKVAAEKEACQKRRGGYSIGRGAVAGIMGQFCGLQHYPK
jgi:hypothetical protein